MSNPSVVRSSESEKIRIAKISLGITLILIVLKTTAGILSGSLALLSVATDSIFDFLAVLVTLIAVKVSAMPADEEHPYGHGKVDSISGLFQSVFLLGVCVWIILEAIHRLRNPSPEDLNIDAVTFIILTISLALDLWRARTLSRTSREHHSQALRADSLHFLADGLSVIMVIVGIIIAKFFHLPAADAVTAVAVSLFVGFQSIKLGKEAIDVLMDRIPSSIDQDAIRSAITSTAGVYQLLNLRMRESASTVFIDCYIAVNRAYPYASISQILDNVKASVKQLNPNAEISIEWRAVKTENESPFEAVKIITAEYGIMPHNIELSRDLTGKTTLDLHIEFPAGTDFIAAHTKSEEIEKALRDELHGIDNVVTHLEEERSDITLSTFDDVTLKFQPIVNTIQLFTKEEDVIAIEDVKVLESVADGKLKIVFTVILNASLSLHSAHQRVTEIEAVLRKTYPDVSRIIIHTEPFLK